MYLLGTILILAGIAVAFAASASYALTIRGYGGALRYGRLFTHGALAAVLLVVGLLAYLFVARRYDIKYVYDYSADNLEFFFRVAAMWAGQPGSFVVWALWGLIAAQLLVGRTRHNEPYVLSVFMLIQGALLVYMLIRNPFVPYTENGLAVVPPDGKGLNELLHNFWMIIHPPILFVGYALLAVPFAFAIAGLWRRDYDGWARQALPWTLAGWAFLGLALLLGGYWAYETLGWGGYWGWDPVENSALVPWLTATALIHALLIQRTQGGLRRTTFVLAILTYVLVFYATFLTRSGVLSSFSVHSFVEEGLKWVMIGSLALLAAASLAVLAWRWRDIPARPLSDRLLSRDSFFVLGIIVLLVIATVIGLGTSMPLISAIPGVGHALQSFFSMFARIDNGTYYDPNATPFTDGRFGLVGDFYGTAVPPIALLLLILLIVGPLLGWRDTNPRALLRALRWPAVGAVAASCTAIGLAAYHGLHLNWLGLGFVGLGAFATGTNAVMIVRTLRGGFLRIGGYLAHLGLALLLAGAVASTVYASPEQKLVIPEGQTISAYGYDFVFNGWRTTPQGKGLLDITVTKGPNDTFNATPLLYFNQRMGATMATPSIKPELFQDLYISPQEYQPPVDRNLAQLGVNDTANVGPYRITFLGFETDQAHTTGSADIGAKLRVTVDGKDTELTPKLRLNANQVDPSKSVELLPATLPDGRLVTIENLDPTARRVLIRVAGLNLPIEPGKAVVTISVKPGMLLVWTGVVIGVLGGAIAIIRRSLENRARRRRQPAPQPRLGELGPAVSGD
jgi:cytochrome c-type biogenesis protein CcmF